MNRLARSAHHRSAIAAALLVLGVLAAGSVPAPAAESPPIPPPTRLLQISLLAASKTGPSELADLPANTRQAIEDIRQFLPFKSYRMLDTALVRSSRGARTTLRGPGEREYRVALNFLQQPQDDKLQVLHFELVQERPLAVAFSARDAARATGGESPPLAPRPPLGPVISTSFSAEIGQTVVVGSSRLDGGDEALVVLFTALP